MRILVSCMTVTVAAVVWNARLDASQLRVVAIASKPFSGSAHPFEGFGGISLNNAGEVAFSSRRFLDPEGLIQSGGVWFQGLGMDLSMIDGPRFAHYDLALTESGQMYFKNGDALVQGSPSNDLKVIVGTGLTAPGIVPQAKFTNNFTLVERQLTIGILWPLWVMQLANRGFGQGRNIRSHLLRRVARRLREIRRGAYSTSSQIHN